MKIHSKLLHVSSLLFCLLLVISIEPIQGQNSTKNIRGQVLDKGTKQAIAGATIQVKDLLPIIGTVTDEEGRFVLENVPIGRRQIECQFIGYDTYISEAFILNSVKDVVLTVELLEGAITTEAVVVKALRNPNDPLNELAIVSTRSFSVEETERIPASVNDPGRMAMAFPGVQQGGDDNTNDIIVRGNSSVGVLWRLEGIDIPNPNHFARPGTSGGGITVFSAQLLSRSDFSTGAFPAEYGNALSGAFDVHFRKGNQQERDHRVKIGLLGLDFATEGPIKKDQSSYLINYRYSTLGLLNSLGFSLVGERVDNDFQDLSFNFSFSGSDKKTFFNVFGMGGLSEEHYRPVAEASERDLSRPNHSEDRINASDMGLIGFSMTKLLDEKSYLKWVVSGMGSEIIRDYDTLSVENVPFKYESQKYLDRRLSTSLTYQRKINPQTRFKTGLMAHQIFFDFFKETKPRQSISDINELQRLTNNSINGGGNTQTLQYYGQFNFRPNDRLHFNAGLHFVYLNLNKTFSPEPRLSMRYELGPRSNINIAYGLHGQMLPLAAYFYQQRDTINGQVQISNPNFDLPMMKSHHLVLGYNFSTAGNLKITAETYLQRLFNVPVEPNNSSLYWQLIRQEEFPEFNATSDGKGLNYGIDLAVEKFFSNKFYFLLTSSFFDASFQPFNQERYNSRFNTRFVSTYTIGREFTFKKGGVLQIGTRVMYNGGFRYSPYDPVRSAEAGRYVALAGAEWSEQVNPYFRMDGRVSIRANKKKFASVISLDIQNISNRRNPQSIGYSATTNETFLRFHTSGFVPVLSFQFDF